MPLERKAVSGMMLALFLLSILTLAFNIRTVRAGDYSDVTVSQAKAMIDSNPSLVVLDVRTQSEYDSGHIRNAKLIPHTELQTRLDELGINDEILVYCRTGFRSRIASQILVDNDFLHVYNMLGGIIAWIDEGYPVDSGFLSISIVSPENKTYAMADITLTFTVDESVAWMAYSLDNKANMTTTGNTTLYELSNGLHSLIVYAEDTAGNTGASGIVYFSVDVKGLEPFPLWIVAVAAMIAAFGTAVYLLKIRNKN